MWNFYNVFRRFCAFVIGMVFFLSGILKLMDPVGAGLVVGEYFRFMHLGFMVRVSYIVGAVLAFAETILGVALMAGLWRRVVSIVTYVFLGAYTVLTVFLLIFNPTMDCGCFGEALHLTHLQSFIKNVVMLALAVVAFVPGRLGRPRKRKYVAFGIVSALSVAFGIYSMFTIPLVDFTEFRPGTRLAASVEIFTDAYSASFVYEKDGEERVFQLDNLPDSTWTFVRTETTRVTQADDVAALSFYDRSGVYRDELATRENVLVYSFYNMKRIPKRRLERIAWAVQDSWDAGYVPIVLSSSDYSTVSHKLLRKLKGDGKGTEVAGTILSNLYFADSKTILSLNRSNGGATYFRNGTLVMKWGGRNLPKWERMNRILESDAAETVVETTIHRNLVYEAVVLVAFAVLFFI